MMRATVMRISDVAERIECVQWGPGQEWFFGQLDEQVKGRQM